MILAKDILCYKTFFVMMCVVRHLSVIYYKFTNHRDACSFVLVQLTS